jgi:hypothetical protein
LEIENGGVNTPVPLMTILAISLPTLFCSYDKGDKTAAFENPEHLASISYSSLPGFAIILATRCW